MKHLKKMLVITLAIVSVLMTTTSALATPSANVDNLNVRSGPGTSYSRLGEQIAEGSTFDVVFRAYGSLLNGSRDWYYVEFIDCACGSPSCYAPSAGYIHSSYIDDLVIIRIAPTNKDQAFGPTTLRYGSRGPAVYNVQLVLWANGCLDNLDDCDGVYGGATTAAVEEFQQMHYLEDVDGLVGPETKQEMWFERFFENDNDVLSMYGVQW